MLNKHLAATENYLLEIDEGGVKYQVVNIKTGITEYSDPQLGHCLFQMQAMENVLVKAKKEGLYEA